MYNAFRIIRLNGSFRFKDRRNIKTGCCINGFDDNYVGTVGEYPTYEAAMKELENKKYKPTCSRTSGFSGSSFYAVDEYMVECYEADEDGEFIRGSDLDSPWEYYFDSEADGIVVSRRK